MWHIGENKYPQQAVLWSAEDKGSYALVKLGTSRKDKSSDSYVNSNWSFVRFVGNAYKGIMDVPEKTRIVIKAGGISQEPYMKDNVRTWPKNPQIVVFAWDFPEDVDRSASSNHVDEEEDSDEPLPF